MKVIISGGGIAGVATAHRLATKYGVRNVTVVDRYSPLSMTSAVSTECFRNVWSDSRMTSLTNRSIDILEELAIHSDNYFNLSRRGYVYVTKSQRLANDFCHLAKSSNDFEAYTDEDVNLKFPYVAEDSVCVLHAKRAGWMDAQQLGQYMIREAKDAGVQFLRGDITQVDAFESHVEVQINTMKEDTISLEASHFVNASGPWANEMNERIIFESKAFPKLPLHNELHAKIILHDTQGLIPNDAPMVICADEIELPWDEDMKEFLRDTQNEKYLEKLPPGLHFRPSSTEGYVFALWDFVHQGVETSHISPPHVLEPDLFDDLYVEIVLRGLACTIGTPLQSMVDAGYFGKNTTVDGGFYTHTPDNTPLIGLVQDNLKTVSTISGLAGYGIMTACGAADLLCCEITSSEDLEVRNLLDSFKPTREFSSFSSDLSTDNDENPYISRALKIIGGSI